MGFFFFPAVAVTAPTPTLVSAPKIIPDLPTYIVGITGYNAVPEQTDEDPFTTASGAYSNPEVIAARSRDFAEELPFGTIIEFAAPAERQQNCGYDAVSPEIGYRIIADTMNARYTNRVDILFATSSVYSVSGGKRNASELLGNCRGVTIRVVGRLDGTRPYRFPKTQAALAALVRGIEPLAVR